MSSSQQDNSAKQVTSGKDRGGKSGSGHGFEDKDKSAESQKGDDSSEDEYQSYSDQCYRDQKYWDDAYRDDNDDDPPFRGGWTTKDGEKSKPKPEPAPVTNPR